MLSLRCGARTRIEPLKYGYMALTSNLRVQPSTLNPKSQRQMCRGSAWAFLGDWIRGDPLVTGSPMVLWGPEASRVKSNIMKYVPM